MDNDDIEKFLALMTEGIAASPTVGLLYLFYSVRKNNYSSGRNSIPQQIAVASLPGPATGSTANVPQAVVNQIVTGVNTIRGINSITPTQALSWIESTAQALGKDETAVASYLANLFGGL